MSASKAAQRSSVAASTSPSTLGAGAAPARKLDVPYTSHISAYNSSTYRALVNQTDYTSTGSEFERRDAMDSISGWLGFRYCRWPKRRHSASEQHCNTSSTS